MIPVEWKQFVGAHIDGAWWGSTACGTHMLWLLGKTGSTPGVKRTRPVQRLRQWATAVALNVLPQADDEEANYVIELAGEWSNGGSFAPVEKIIKATLDVHRELDRARATAYYVAYFAMHDTAYPTITAFDDAFSRACAVLFAEADQPALACAVRNLVTWKDVEDEVKDVVR